MKKSAILAIVGLAGAANAQTFASYDITAENLTDAGRGTANAEVGDVFRVCLIVNHDALSYGGGKVDILLDGDFNGVGLPENGGTLPPELDPTYSLGRHPLTRIAASDKPVGSAFNGNLEVDYRATAGTVYAGIADAAITDPNLGAGSSGFFDFTSSPPGLGGLAGAFPMSDGEGIFYFEVVYKGGKLAIFAAPDATARLWRNGADLNGAVVPASAGDGVSITPAPASLALLGLGGLVAGRRRR